MVSHCNSQGSCVYACSLDAEGAFDNIPHAVLFMRAMNIIPDPCWKILVNWYSNLRVQVKWNNRLSDSVSIRIGTRQGGLTSPFLFNIFYQGMIERLNDKHCGINMYGFNLNVCCYADDILLLSLSPSGLQDLIYCANSYIRDHGLRFNPVKTQCIVLGKSRLQYEPQWTLCDTKLEIHDNIKYLGVVLSNNNDDHVQSRIQACRKAFYCLQGAGLCKRGASVKVVLQLWNTILRPILLYGTHCIKLTQKSLKDLESTQAKLLKAALCLSKICRTTPLIDAFHVPSVARSIEINRLNLLRSAMNTDSIGSEYLSHIVGDHIMNIAIDHNNLIHQCIGICNNHELSHINCMMDGQYLKRAKKQMNSKSSHVPNGMADTVNYLLSTSQLDNRHLLVNLLLRPF